MNGLEHALRGVRTVAIICNQWGDTGKGKLVDMLAQKWADIIARGTGGANAGHTVVYNGEEFIFHLIPSGILHDSKGKINVMGEGMVIDPSTLIEEMVALEQSNHSYHNLRISHHSKIVLPHHILLDRAKESKKGGRIGTTGRGIGPAYEDHVARRGIIMNDLLNPPVFAAKLSKITAHTTQQLKAMEIDSETIQAILQSPAAGGGRFYDAEKTLNQEAILQAYVNEYGAKLNPFISDTESFLQENAGKKNILLEGAQGHLLSIDYGTNPYVTSSDPSVRGLAKGVGLLEKDVDLTFGIAKAYMTRVGNGPFPTEFGGKQSEVYCDDHSHNREYEKEAYKHATVNDSDPLIQGMAFRILGGEYGATTKRPRRTGWLDLVALQYAMKTNGNNLFLTKVDVLDGCDEIKLCTHYMYEGPDYIYAGQTLRKGDVFTRFPRDSNILYAVQPGYVTVKGWKTPTSHIENPEQLPTELHEMIRVIETETKGNVIGISNGADREKIIFLHSPNVMAAQKS